MDTGKQEISTPIEQGTLSARIVWDNDAECDGIEVILLRPNGDEEMLFRTTSAEYGMSCLVSLPIDDLDWGIEPRIGVDDTRCVLDLESGKE